MPIDVEFTKLPDLPKLGWIARLDPVGGKLRAYHGASVERGDGWLVEGVWGGDFARGNFHRSESFFGSGIRVDGERVHFVPSSTTIDRLFWCRGSGEMLVSNSLIILMAATGAVLDEAHDYHRESLSILQGLRACRGKFRIVHPAISDFRQVFLENVVASRDGVTYASRFRRHAFRSFDDYFGLLTETLARMRENYEDPSRKIPVKAFTTTSSGYDSTAVSCLANRLGVKECFTARQAYSMLPSWLPGGHAVDDGTPIAQRLGMHVHHLEAPEKIRAEDELHFLAIPYARFSGLVLNETIFHSMASHIERTCRAAIVFTGQYGGTIWSGKEGHGHLSGDISRSVTSGLNLAEIRLKSGFFNVAVPFLFAINTPDIIKICDSPKMAPWRLNNGYDRPIARRIAEDAGIPRDIFGQHKKSVCNYFRYPNNPRLRRAFFEHLEKRYGVDRGWIYLGHGVNQAALFVQKALTHLGVRSGGYNRLVFMKNLDMPFLMWLWSAGILSRQLAGRFDAISHRIASGQR